MSILGVNGAKNRNTFHALQNKIFKTLGITQQEWPRVLSICVFFFIMRMSISLGNAVKNSYFIQHAGAKQLPYMYLFIAVMTFLIYIAYTHITARVGRYAFYYIIFNVYAVFLIFCWEFVRVDAPFMPYILFGVPDVMVVIVLRHFWGIATTTFDPREGKRIFPIIGGAGLLGIVAGGASVNPLISFFGPTNIILVWSFLSLSLISLIYWIRKIALTHRPVTYVRKEPSHKNGPKEVSVLKGTTKTWPIPMVRAMTFSTIPMIMVVYFLDFQFYETMGTVYQDQETLATFLGTFDSIVSITGFFIQFFVVGRVLRKFGAASTIIGYPITMTIGVGAIALSEIVPSPEVITLLSFQAIAILIAKFTENTIYSSIKEVTNILLYSCIGEDKRDQSRSFIYAFITPGGIAIAAILLILLTIILAVPIYVIAILTVILNGIWIAFAYNIKATYLKARIDNLGSNNMDMAKNAITELERINDTELKKVLFEGLASSQDEVAQFSLESLRGLKGDIFEKKVVSILPQVRPRIRAAILVALGERGSAKALPLLRKELEGKNPFLRAAALKAISQQRSWRTVEMFELYLDDPDLEVRSEALTVLLRMDKNIDPKSEEKSKYRTILEEMVKDDRNKIRLKAAFIIGESRRSQLAPLLNKMSISTDERMLEEVIEAMAKLGGKQVVSRLARLMRNEQLKSKAAEAIVNQGNSSLEALHKELNSKMLKDEIKIEIIRCIGKISNPNSLLPLFSLIEDPPREYIEDVMNSLASIKFRILETESALVLDQYFSPHMRKVFSTIIHEEIKKIHAQNVTTEFLRGEENKDATSLLIDALDRDMQHIEDVAMKCMELLYDQRSMQISTFNLKYADSNARAEALEVIENSSADGLALVEAIEHKYFPKHLYQKADNLNKLFEALVRKKLSDWTMTCVIFAIGELKLEGMKTFLEGMQSGFGPSARINKNSFICSLLSLRKLGVDNEVTQNPEVKKMEEQMHKILFLRTVRLFSNLDGKDLQWMSGIIKEKEFPADTIIYEEGEIPHAVYILIEGQVRLLKGKQQIVLDILERGDSFGELEILDHAPRFSTAETRTDTKAFEIRRNDFQRLLSARTQMSFSIFRNLCGRVRTLGNMLVQEE